jgi:acetate kinase
MLILVINCGSSSVKYDLFDAVKERSLCRGAVERIGEKDSSITHSSRGQSVNKRSYCPNHRKAIEIIWSFLGDPGHGVLSDISDVAGIGHRVVHGGEEFSSTTLVDDNVIRIIERFSDLAPLHNPPFLKGLEGCMAIFKGVPQVAVFDTAFHQTIPEKAFIYGLPYEFYEESGIRRYGFHGTSHKYVSEKTAEMLNKPLGELNLITVHLGNGCSITAVEKGRSVDTSMGYTPLEGLLMGTRAGDLDPSVVVHLAKKKVPGLEDIDPFLNNKCGLLGISGISNDMRDILAAMKNGNDRAKLAYDVFVYRIIKYVGAYAAVLGSVDAVVFTAGIGENVPDVKNSVKEQLHRLLGNRTKFLTVATNEELLIARETYNLVKGKAK